MYLSSISHFYETNYVILRWKKLKKFIGKLKSVVEDQPSTREQIKTLNAAPPRDKCIILVMVSAGLRRGALSYLRTKDLQEIDKYNLHKLDVYKREQEQYSIFCTRKCAICFFASFSNRLL
jgi:integrase